MKRKKTLEAYAMNHSNKFAIRHTMTNSGSNNSSAGTHRATAAAEKYIAGIYKHILVRRTAAYSVIIKIDQVPVLSCENAHGVFVTKRD